ncbi:MAG: hypothetical protein F4187_02680 [Gemmatimonadetes bacterium]|nr:hypothetical protein [Gemmatimonadota bacterium]
MAWTSPRRNHTTCRPPVLWGRPATVARSLIWATTSPAVRSSSSIGRGASTHSEKQGTGAMRISRIAAPAALLGTLAFVACGGGDDNGPTEPSGPASISLSPQSSTMDFIGQTRTFRATVRDANGQTVTTQVSWTSSDPSVFTVDASGVATAVGNGSAQVEASAGAVSATAAVTVEQRPAVLVVLSGDGQEGFAGAALPNPVVVQVTDQGGTAVRGVVVSFAPGEGAGSVNPQNAVSDADGHASTEWTLGDGRFGAMSLRASVEQGAATFINARAVPETPIPDLAIEGGLSLSRDDPGSLETIDVTLRVANLGNAATPAVFPLTLTVDGTEVETFEIDELAVEERVSLTYTLDPLEAGSREIAFELDAAGEIEEWTEDNNATTALVNVLSQTAIDPDQPVTVSSSTVNELLLFRIDIAESAQQVLNVELSGGSGDADMFVHFGERPENRYEYECLSGNPASDELCQMVPTRVGSYHVAVHAFTAFGPSTLTVTVGGKPVETFDIEVVFLDNGTPSQDNIVREAAEVWESIIARGAEDYDFSISSASNYPADECFEGQPLVADVVDDLRVWVTIDSIDGQGGAVASAGPCWARAIQFTGSDVIWLEAVLGRIRLDEADAAALEARGKLHSVVVHELAHTLGFGTLWELKDLLRNPSFPDSPNADTHFAGPLAIAAFDAAGGTSYVGGKVPVESGARPGSSEGHWREGVFETELMTPFLEPSREPLSLVTIESLADLGYGVDLTKAESYTLSSTGLAGMAVPRGPVIYLGDDIARNPITVVDQKGRLLGVYRSRRQ